MNQTLKNPVKVVRTPDKINQEYSNLVLKLGGFSIELHAINERNHQIDQERKLIFSKIKELNDEMNEAQAEIKRKEALEPKEVSPEEVST